MVKVAKVTSEEGNIDNVVETSDPIELLSLEDYVARAEVHEGLVASFKAEPLNDISTPRGADQWKIDFNAQANRVYK